MLGQLSFYILCHCCTKWWVLLTTQASCLAYYVFIDIKDKTSFYQPAKPPSCYSPYLSYSTITYVHIIYFYINTQTVKHDKIRYACISFYRCLLNSLNQGAGLNFKPPVNQTRSPAEMPVHVGGSVEFRTPSSQHTKLPPPSPVTTWGIISFFKKKKKVIFTVFKKKIGIGKYYVMGVFHC